LFVIFLQVLIFGFLVAVPNAFTAPLLGDRNHNTGDVKGYRTSGYYVQEKYARDFSKENRIAATVGLSASADPAPVQALVHETLPFYIPESSPASLYN
jgi:hypothetical protein